MFLTQAPLGKFILGYVDPVVLDVVATPKPTLDELINQGNATLARVIVTRRGVDLYQLPILGGGVDVQTSEGVRRTLKAQLNVNGLTAAEIRDLLDPSQWFELRAEIGVYDPYGDTEWFPMGVFTLTSADWDLTNDDSTLSIHCPDRVAAIKRTKMLKGENVPEAFLTDAVVQVMGSVAGDWLPMKMPKNQYGWLQPAVLGDIGGDAWDACRELCEANAVTMFIDRFGTFTVNRLTALKETPISARWITRDKTLITDLSQSVDITNLATGVIIKWGSKPNEVLYYPDRYQRYYTVHSGDKTMMSGTGGIGAIGNSILAKTRRGVETIDFTVMCDPRRDVDEAIHLAYVGGDLEGVCRIESLTYTFGEPTMKVSVSDRYYKQS